MTLYEKFEDIKDTCYEKKYYARSKQFEFAEEDYLWVLGIDVVKCLEYGLGEVVVHYLYTPEKNVYKLMGIPIQIDYERKDIIKLYKEV